jgi:hypothetical protein
MQGRGRRPRVHLTSALDAQRRPVVVVALHAIDQKATPASRHSPRVLGNLRTLPGRPGRTPASPFESCSRWALLAPSRLRLRRCAKVLLGRAARASSRPPCAGGLSRLRARMAMTAFVPAPAPRRAEQREADGWQPISRRRNYPEGVLRPHVRALRKRRGPQPRRRLRRRFRGQQENF